MYAKKRLMVVVLVFVLLSLSVVALEVDQENGMTYGYVTYLSIEDDDDICQSPETSAFHTGFVVGDDRGATIHFIRTNGLQECSFVERVHGDCEPKTCQWNGLPKNKGCYFLTEELDHLPGDTINYAVNKLPDCAGWGFPTGAIIPAEAGTAREFLFEDADNLEGVDVFEDAQMHELVALGTVRRILGDTGGPEGRAQYTHPYLEPDGTVQNAVCAIDYPLHFDTPKLCYEKDNEFRWYQCDATSLGKWFPIPEPEDGAVEEPAPDQPEAWVCERIDNTFVWNPRDLTCDDDGIDCDANAHACENNGGVYLADAQIPNKCCGNNPTDLGVIMEDAQGGQHICLGDVDRDALTYHGNPLESDDWRWAAAENVQERFKVYTLDGDRDVVSNGKTWNFCDASTVDDETKNVLQPSNVNAEEEGRSPNKLANSFHCYKEGGRHVWAECGYLQSRNEDSDVYVYADNVDNGPKQRIVGDGLFTLPVRSERGSVNIDLTTAYMDYYGQQSLNFTDYNAIEFFVQFTELPEPLQYIDVQLQLFSPGSHILLDEVVLGHASQQISLDALGEKWVHVTVPLPGQGMGNVGRIKISGTPEPFAENVRVKNVFLSNNAAGQDTFGPICSGKESEESNAWIEDINTFEPDSAINGQEICQEWFGEDAWQGIGNQQQCCGIRKGEYFSLETPDNEGNSQACWNSVTIQHNEDFMNVEFWEEHTVFTSEIVSYEPVRISPLQFTTMNGQDGSGVGFRTIRTTFFQGQVDEEHVEESATLVACGFDPIIVPNNPPIEEGQTKVLCEFTPRDVSVDNFRRHTSEIIVNQPQNSLYEFEFVDKLNGQVLGGTQNGVYVIPKHEVANFWIMPIQVLARLKTPNLLVAEQNTIPHPSLQRKRTVTCTEEECIFPLPGNHPHTIENRNPGLYDLYYVDKNGEWLITPDSPTSQNPSLLKAKRVPQQVKYVNDDINSGFFGCQADWLVARLPPNQRANIRLDSVSYCDPRGDAICAAQQNSDGKTIINTWSTQPLHQVGYTLAEGEYGTPEARYESLTLTDLEEPVAATDRIHYSESVPQRNLLMNSDFTPGVIQLTQGNVEGWTIHKSGTPVLNEFTTLQQLRDAEGNVFLTDEEFVSEQVYLAGKRQLIAGGETDCGVDGTFYDNNGQLLERKELIPAGHFDTEFHTTKTSIPENSAWATFHYSGPGCQLQNPFVWIGDDVEQPTEHTPSLGSNQAMAACCPTNHCWNGRTCVDAAVMAEHPDVAEILPDGNAYRCVEGEWTPQVMKYDWKHEGWGFCLAEGQCLVSNQGDPAATAQSFRSNIFRREPAVLPSCIGDGEYVLDHYCDGGDWTSRTKFVAAHLLKSLEGADDYTLYCTSPHDAVPEPGLVTPFLGKAELSGPDCFDGALTDSVFQGDPLGCLNNICVVTYGDGEDQQRVFATSLNNRLDDTPSILHAAGVTGDLPQIAANCAGADFDNCVGDGVAYSSGLNAIVFGEIDLPVWEDAKRFIANLFQNFFGQESVLSEEEEFLAEAHNFREIYVRKNGDQIVRAVKEIKNEEQRTIIAEYAGFETPICEYTGTTLCDGDDCQYSGRIFPEGREIGTQLLDCKIVDGVHQVEVINSVDDLWPQMTGSLR